jgi:hypothetical protein
MGIVRYEVFRAVAMKNAIILDVAPSGSYGIDVSEEHVASIINLMKKESFSW